MIELRIMNKKSFRQISNLLIFLIFLISNLVFSNTYYVSPDGDDSNSGTLEQPFATVSKAVSVVQPGTAIYLREGFYRCDYKISLSKGGTAENPVELRAYPGEIPILDFTDGGVSTSARGFNLSADYWLLYGFVIQNAGDNAINVSGAHNIIENLVVRYNHDSGIQLHTGAAFNQVINCDSYGNYDPGNNGENADGFAAKFGVGEGNVFKGCRAWNNSDDGYDFWKAGNGVIAEDCQAFRNGINRWGDTSFEGDGNGYKLGQGGGAHVLIRCIAFDNPKDGIDINGNLTGVTIYNCTGYRNGNYDFYFGASLQHLLRNNLSVANDVRMGSVVDHQFNSWNGMTVTESDFLSLDTTGVTISRNTDGSLSATDFLRLSPGSALIDAGVDVGLEFHGAAPDIGAFETDAGTHVEFNGFQQPGKFVLHQNYPNPFNPTTHIEFRLPESGHVTLSIYNAMGQLIETIIDANMESGFHSITFDAANYSSGIYFYKIKTANFNDVKKMLLLK